MIWCHSQKYSQTKKRIVYINRIIAINYGLNKD